MFTAELYDKLDELKWDALALEEAIAGLSFDVSVSNVVVSAYLLDAQAHLNKAMDEITDAMALTKGD